MLAIDADSHFVEPQDLFAQHIESRFRDRACKLEQDPATGRTLELEAELFRPAGPRSCGPRQWTAEISGRRPNYGLGAHADVRTHALAAAAQQL